MTTVKFHAIRTPMTFVMLGAGFAILLSPLFILYFDPAQNFSFTFRWFAVFPIALYIFFTYVLIASSLKMFTTYSINERGVSIYVPPFHTCKFSVNDIKEVKLLSGEETRKIIEASMLEQNRYGESADLVGYVQMLRKRSPAFRYFTIAPTASVTTVGPKETITSLKVKSTRGSITLGLNNNDVFFLTPDDPEKFYNTFQHMHSK